MPDWASSGAAHGHIRNAISNWDGSRASERQSIPCVQSTSAQPLTVRSPKSHLVTRSLLRLCLHRHHNRKHYTHRLTGRKQHFICLPTSAAEPKKEHHRRHTRTHARTQSMATREGKTDFFQIGMVHTHTHTHCRHKNKSATSCARRDRNAERTKCCEEHSISALHYISRVHTHWNRSCVMRAQFFVRLFVVFLSIRCCFWGFFFAAAAVAVRDVIGVVVRSLHLGSIRTEHRNQHMLTLDMAALDECGKKDHWA